MRKTYRAAFVLVLACTACSLSTIGLLGVGEQQSGDAGTDAPGGGDLDVAPGADGDRPLGDAGSDAVVQGPDCGGQYNPLFDAGYLIARMLPPDASITVNGELSDWSCVPFVHLGVDSAAYVVPPGGPSSSDGDFAMRWTPQAIYFAVRVQSDYSGNNATISWQNDSAELYISGASSPGVYFTANDHHYIVDHKNLAKDYFGPTSSERPSLTGFTSAVQKVDGGFVLEMSVSAGALGIGTLGGNVLGFDVQMSNGNGTTQPSYLVWANRAAPCPAQVDASASCCGQTQDLPYCNPAKWGHVELSP